MECSFGLKGADYVLIAADGSAPRSIVKFKDTEDKITQLDTHTVMSAVGEIGDRQQFIDFIAKNLAFKHLVMNLEPSTLAVASFTRKELADALRKHMYAIDLIIGGYDTKPSLYYLDYLASLSDVNTAAHGYGAYFLYSLLDNQYQPNMSLEQGLDIIKKCINELRVRYVINVNNFIVKCVDKDGVRLINIHD